MERKAYYLCVCVFIHVGNTWLCKSALFGADLYRAHA